MPKGNKEATGRPPSQAPRIRKTFRFNENEFSLLQKLAKDRNTTMTQTVIAGLKLLARQQ